jgi:ribosomal protein L34E
MTSTDVTSATAFAHPTDATADPALLLIQEENRPEFWGTLRTPEGRLAWNANPNLKSYSNRINNHKAFDRMHFAIPTRTNRLTKLAATKLVVGSKRTRDDDYRCGRCDRPLVNVNSRLEPELYYKNVSLDRVDPNLPHDEPNNLCVRCTGCNIIGGAKVDKPLLMLHWNETRTPEENVQYYSLQKRDREAEEEHRVDLAEQEAMGERDPAVREASKRPLAKSLYPDALAAFLAKTHELPDVPEGATCESAEGCQEPVVVVLADGRKRCGLHCTEDFQPLNEAIKAFRETLATEGKVTDQAQIQELRDLTARFQ